MGVKKKVIIIILIFLLLVSGCSRKKSVASDISKDLHIEDKKINIGSFETSNTVGFLKIIDRYSEDEDETKLSFKVYDDIEDIERDMKRGRLDIVALPIDFALEIYRDNTKIKLAAINSLGQYYIMSREKELLDLEDLNNRTIYTSKENNLKNTSVKALFKKAGLKVKIKYMEDDEIKNKIEKDKSIIVLADEPLASDLEINKEMEVLFNLNEEWSRLYRGELLVTGVLGVSEDFLRENREEFDNFLNKYESSLKYTITNLEDTVKLASDVGIIDYDMGLSALPRYNLVYIDGSKMERHIKVYLTNVSNLEGSFLDELPDKDFYYFK